MKNTYTFRSWNAVAQKWVLIQVKAVDATKAFAKVRKLGDVKLVRASVPVIWEVVICSSETSYADRKYVEAHTAEEAIDDVEQGLGIPYDCIVAFYENELPF